MLGVGHGTDYGDAAATGIKQVISRGGGPFAIANHYVRRVDAEQTFTTVRAGNRHPKPRYRQPSSSEGLKDEPVRAVRAHRCDAFQLAGTIVVMDSTMTP